MSFPDLVAHYRHVLGVEQWLDSGMSWTVIQPLDEPMDIVEVAELLGGPDTGIEEADVEGDGVFIDEVGPSIMILDLEGSLVSPHVPTSVERLADNARIWHLSWNVNGHAHLLYAADGRLRLTVPELDPRQAYGPSRHSLDHLVRRLPKPFTPLSRASAMALVQSDSGAHLDLEWLNTPQRALVFEARRPT